MAKLCIVKSKNKEINKKVNFALFRDKLDYHDILLYREVFRLLKNSNEIAIIEENHNQASFLVQYSLSLRRVRKTF